MFRSNKREIIRHRAVTRTSSFPLAPSHLSTSRTLDLRQDHHTASFLLPKPFAGYDCSPHEHTLRFAVEPPRGSGFILCDIPSRRDAVPEVFGASLAPPQTEPGSSGLTGSEDESAVRPRTSAHDAREIHPTHVVHLDAGRDYIVEKCGKSTDGGKNIVDQIKIELEQYLAEERDLSGPEVVSPKKEPAQQVVGQEPSNARNVWMPRTVRALRDNFGAEAVTLEAERDVSATVEALDLFLTGGEVPASVRMLSDDGDENTTLSGEEDGSEPDVSKPKGTSKPFASWKWLLLQTHLSRKTWQ